MSSVIVALQAPREFFPGDKVQGTVILILNDRTPVKNISVRLVGSQRVVYNFINSRNNYKTDVAQDKEAILTPNFFSKQIDEVKEAGEHHFEFEGVIPGDVLPSATHDFRRHMMFFGERVYFLFALVDVEQPALVACQIPVTIKALADPVLFSAPIYPTTAQTDLVFLCCINKGRVTLSGVPENPCLKAGETLRVKVSVDNSSQYEQKGIKARLTRTVRFQKKGVKSSLNADFVEIFEQVLCPVLATGSKFEQTVEIVVPENAMPNFKSEMFSAEYHFRLETDSFDVPERIVKFPVVIASK